MIGPSFSTLSKRGIDKKEARLERKALAGEINVSIQEGEGRDLYDTDSGLGGTGTRHARLDGSRPARRWRSTQTQNLTGRVGACCIIGTDPLSIRTTRQP